MPARLRKPRGSQIAPQMLICGAHKVNVSVTPSNESWTKQNAMNHGRRTCIVQSIHRELHFPKSRSIWAYHPCMHVPKLTGSFWKSLAPLASQPQHTTGIRDFTHTLGAVISATNRFTDLSFHLQSARLAVNWHLSPNCPASAGLSPQRYPRTICHQSYSAQGGNLRNACEDYGIAETRLSIFLTL